MPNRLIVLDSNTGKKYERYSIDAKEMVANDPGRYSIVDSTEGGPGRPGFTDLRGKHQIPFDSGQVGVGASDS